MDIGRVRYFQVFAETGSLVKASEVLHVSQPALSKALRLLEQEVGAKLLEPEGRGLRLTPAGQRFKNETAGLLDQWLKIPENLLRSDAEKSPYRLGSFEVFTTYFLGHLMKSVDLGPLELHEYRPGRLEQAIADGVVDIGITYAPIPKAGVDFAEVTKIKMGIFGLKKFRSQSWSELPFVVPLLPTQGTPSKVQGLDGWPDHEYNRQILYRVTMMESALELCRQGACVAYLPEFVVSLHNKAILPEFRLIELESPLPQKERKQSVFLIQRKNNVESTLYRQIAKSLRNLS
ncbi:LysR family transcriptional regulator [Bdellovibrio bacteriovorus]|uniref:LysR family transcriptional regulator n=1 Tax=Bdellovibrio bacteriovorus TaxID=959 RepID=UPI0009B6FD36|nr:LysR family transcriptional regulator [Bdellovibrio bacteriovorus]